MIKKHSDDPDVKAAAIAATGIVNDVLNNLPKAETYDYGGHLLKLDEYGVCTVCTSAIAEAQAAEKALRGRAESEKDDLVREHLDMAVQLFRLDAEAAILRAELHSGQGSEAALNRILGFEYDRRTGDRPDHSHHGGQA